MVDPIRQQFSLLDSQVSLLSGLAFALVYATAGFPVARIADRHKRTRLIAAGLVIWSLFTGLFAMARSYWQLFLCRMGVGFGEACLSPAAIPLLADYFSERSLGKAVAIYMLAVPVGNGLASMLGGQLLENFAPEQGFDLWLLGTVQPWQLLLLILGGTGFLLLIFLITVREPARRSRMGNGVSDSAAHQSLADVWRLLTTHAAVFIAVALPLVTSALMYFGVGAWIPSYFIRRVEGDASAAGELLFYWGVLNVFVGATGVLAGGFLADYLSARHEDGMWRTLGVGTFLLGFGFALFSLTGNPLVSLTLLVPGVLGNGIIQSAGITTILKITPNHMRGQMSALYFLLVNLVGAGLGPTLIAVLSDFIFTGETGLGQAMAWTALVTSAATLVMLVKTTNAYQYLRQQAA
jgi:MFS family permease